MTQRNARMALDAALTSFIILSMLVQFTGVALHELAGTAFFVLILVHIGLSAKWMRGAARQAGRGKLHDRTRALAIVATLLALDCAVLIVSSIIISRTLASIGLASTLMSGLWRDVHTVSSYLLCVLTVVHLGLHWSQIFSWMRISYSPARRSAIGRSVCVLGSIGAIALCASCLNAMSLIPSGNAVRSNAETDDSPDSQSDNDNSDDNVPSTVYDNPQTQTRPSPRKPEGARAPSAQGDSGSSSAQGDADSPSTQDSTNSDNPDGSSTESICTLCNKRCPLSNPKCDKPYRAGLI